MQLELRWWFQSVRPGGVSEEMERSQHREGRCAGAEGGVLVPGEAGEFGAGDELCGGAVLLHVGMREDIGVVKQRDALGDAGRRKHGAVAVKLDARQNRRLLPRARPRQLRHHLCRRNSLPQPFKPRLSDFAAGQSRMDPPLPPIILV